MEQSGNYRRTQPYNSLNQAAYVDGLVPPIKTVTSDGKTRVHFADSVSVPVHRSSPYGSDAFLNYLVQSYDIWNAHYVSDWSYQHRHDAQQILPFMLLGPMSFARDRTKVKEAGVTMMIAVRSRKAVKTMPNMMNPALFAADGVQTAVFDVDTPYDIVSGRCKMIKMINDHLEESCHGQNMEVNGAIRGKVLVFCETGNERSPVLPALYIMAVWGLSAVSAVQAVQTHRFGIALDYQMVRMLQNTQLIIAAERDVSASTHLGSSHTQRQGQSQATRKRNADETDDEEMSTNGDYEPVTDMRSGIAPFMDEMQP